MSNSILYEEVKRLENEQSFEAALQNLYTKHIKPSDTVIDVGAHWGRHTLPFSYLVGSSGKVISVEANPSVVTLLNEQLVKFHVDNVDVHSVALSNETQSGMDFFVAVDSPEESGLRLRKIFNNETKLRKEKVDVITLDSLNIKGNVSFIKIDVEGAEFFVIQGAKNTILKYNPVILSLGKIVMTLITLIQVMYINILRLLAMMFFLYMVIYSIIIHLYLVQKFRNFGIISLAQKNLVVVFSNILKVIRP